MANMYNRLVATDSANPDAIRSLADRCRQLFTNSYEKLHSANERIAQWITTTVRIPVKSSWVFTVEVGFFASVGWTMIQLAEYALAVAVFVFIGAILIAKSMAWNGIKGAPGITVLFRVVFVIGSILFSVFWILVT